MRNALKRIENEKKLWLMSGSSLCHRMLNIFKKKKSVSQSTRIALKRIKMQKKFYPFDPLCALRVAQSPSGEAQLYQR